ncbi:MAG: hypothetical protein EBR82_38655 [Caulobacteraceae bacterium]|nr:hypothetical protein [Caulobacteraceae bacterium]
MITRERLTELWFTDKTNAELAALVGCGKYKLWKLKRQYRLPDRPRGTPVEVDPDEATIAARCLEVQARWTPAERARRTVGGASRPVTVPICRLAVH